MPCYVNGRLVELHKLVYLLKHRENSKHVPPAEFPSETNLSKQGHKKAISSSAESWYKRWRKRRSRDPKTRRREPSQSSGTASNRSGDDAERMKPTITSAVLVT